jgi:hypothetical protein
MRNTTAPPNIYFPTFYEMADLKDALDANPHVEPLFAVLDTGYAPGVLDKAVGRGRWLQLSSEKDGPRLVRELRRVMTQPPGGTMLRRGSLGSPRSFAPTG